MYTYIYIHVNVLCEVCMLVIIWREYATLKDIIMYIYIYIYNIYIYAVYFTRARAHTHTHTRKHTHTHTHTHTYTHTHTHTQAQKKGPKNPMDEITGEMESWGTWMSFGIARRASNL